MVASVTLLARKLLNGIILLLINYYIGGIPPLFGAKRVAILGEVEVLTHSSGMYCIKRSPFVEFSI